MNVRWIGRRAIVLTLATFLFPVSALAQQPQAYIGVGYVADAPELFGGGSAHVVTPGLLGGLGLYVDAKFALEDRRDDRAFEPDLTATEVDDLIGDDFRIDDEVWYNVNAALMRPISDDLTLYLGGGYAKVRRYSMYQISEGDASARGIGGIYWVEDVDGAETHVNVLGGAFVRLSQQFVAQFGLERYPRGMTVGLSYRFAL